MRSALLTLCFSAAAALCLPAIAQMQTAATPANPTAKNTSHIGKRHSTPEDLEQIQQVTQAFRAALINKDPKKLSGLLLNSKILFSSPASPTCSRKMQDTVDAGFDGVNAAGVLSFLDFIAKSPEPIEEKFYNINITQDGHLAWVTFDFEFLEGNRIENHGFEVWQMLKTADNSWKILSVVWSSHGAPK